MPYACVGVVPAQMYPSKPLRTHKLTLVAMADAVIVDHLPHLSLYTVPSITAVPRPIFHGVYPQLHSWSWNSSTVGSISPRAFRRRIVRYWPPLGCRHRACVICVICVICVYTTSGVCDTHRRLTLSTSHAEQIINRSSSRWSAWWFSLQQYSSTVHATVHATVHLHLTARADRFLICMIYSTSCCRVRAAQRCMVYNMFPGLDLHCTDPAQHPLTAG